MTNLYNGDSLLIMQDNNVFNPCMGSGTTGVVCKELGKDFIGIEHKK